MDKRIKNNFQELAELVKMDTSAKIRKNRKPSQTIYTNKHLVLDYAACYGGYIIMVVNKTSGQSYFDHFQTSRLPKKEFEAYLTGLLSGLQYKKHLNTK